MLAILKRRTCPLCRGAAGTPRHVIMGCPEMRGIMDALRDLVEEELHLREVPDLLLGVIHT